jgi:hypothetical protein
MRTNQRSTADAGWWDGLSALVEKVLVVGGGNKIMVDDVVFIHGKLRESWRENNEGVLLRIIEKGPHDTMLVDRMLGYNADTFGNDRAVREFAQERVQRDGIAE